MPAIAKTVRHVKTRGPGRPTRGWTRTNIRIDRTKLNTARRLLGLATATETVDAALDAVAFRNEVLSGIDRFLAGPPLVRDPEE